MHSRIFRVICEDEPEEDRIEYTEDEIYEYMNGKADYVDEMPESDKDDFIWLMKAVGNAYDFSYEDRSFTISKDIVRNYFKDRYIELQNRIEELTLDDFCNITDNRPCSYDIWSLGQLLTQDFEFYIMASPGNLMTLDDFLRSCDFDKVYTVTQIYDYHL